MNLLCPTCQKQLQVPEQYAGQMMQCPLCSAKFTVPVLPQMPGAAPMPPPPAPPAPMSVKPPAPAGTPGEAAAPAVGPRSISVNPRIVPFVAPLSLLAIFILMFFPWVGMFPGGVPVVTQNPFQAMIGSCHMDKDWKDYVSQGTNPYLEKYYGTKDVTPLETPSVSVWMIFFVLVIIPAVLAALVSAALSLKLIPIEVPAFLQPFWPMRSLFVGGLALATLIFLLVTLLSGFPVEQKAAEMVKTSIDNAKAKATPSEVKDDKRWNIEGGAMLGGFALRTTPWLILVTVFNILAVIGAGMELWIERRGPERLPRLQVG